MDDKQIIESNRAPAAIGPYSVANRTGNLVFTAGQLGLDPDTMELVPGGIEGETRQALTNLIYVLECGPQYTRQHAKFALLFLCHFAYTTERLVTGQG